MRGGSSPSRRIRCLSALFVAAFVVAGGRLLHVGGAQDALELNESNAPSLQALSSVAEMLLDDPLATDRREPDVVVDSGLNPPRPSIVDRNGYLLASDARAASIYAEPRRVLDPDDAAEKLAPFVTSRSPRRLRALLGGDQAFAWLERDISPRREAEILRLGIPGIGFRYETKRMYPAKRLAAHAVGYADVDSKGSAGIERHLDKGGRLLVASLRDPRAQDRVEAVRLSLDVRAQSVVVESLSAAMEKFSAVAAAGVVLDPNTGEILALASLPDFNPHNRSEALEPDRLNRVTGGVYETGSVMKAMTLAYALEKRLAGLNDRLDARRPLRVGGRTIRDHRPQGRFLSLSETFTHSSNIGAATLVALDSPEAHFEFLRTFDMHRRRPIEIPESARHAFPRRESAIASAVASYGYGFSVQPLHLAAVYASLVNGGRLILPTLLARDVAAARDVSRRVIGEDVSLAMRYLLRLNAEVGSGRKADVVGYAVGGKTGSADKVVDGRYDSERTLATFVAAFPMDDPIAVAVVVLDEPQPLEETFGHATAGWNAAPTVGEMIRRLAPILGVVPRSEEQAASETLKARIPDELFEARLEAVVDDESDVALQQHER